MGFVQGPPEPLDMRFSISHITAASLGAEKYLPCPWGITWRRYPRRTVPQPAEDAIFPRQDIIRAELWYDALMPTLFSRSQCSFPSLSLFSSCNSSEQLSPLLPSPPCGTSSHSTPLELFPAPVPAYIHFFRLMTAAEGLPAAFRGVNASLPMGHFSLDTGWAWVVFAKQDGSPPSPWDQLTHIGLSCPLAGFTSKSPIHQSLQPGLSLPIPPLCAIQFYPAPDPLNHPHHLP